MGKHILLIITLQLFLGQLTAQYECATGFAEENRTFRESLSGNTSEPGKRTLTIQTHIIGDDTAWADSVKNMMYWVNLDFKDAGIDFIVPDFDIIRDTMLGFTGNDERKALLASYHQRNRINLYIVKNLKKGGNNYCGLASMPPENKDYIFITRDCLHRYRLAHFLGHVCGLFHTHETQNDTRPERADGSNCATAGDMICDTPADPGLENEVGQNCKYISGAKDGNGNFYLPSVANIMSVSPVKCRCFFTPGQIAVMRDVVFNHKQYLE